MKFVAQSLKFKAQKDLLGRRVTIISTTFQNTSFILPSIRAWDAFARKIVKRLKPGYILALSGELGMGKTTCVQALARALGIHRLPSSPTFAIMRSYRLPKSVNGIRRLIHVDAYRIENENDLVVLDLEDELSDGCSILVLEWPENVPNWILRHDVTTLHITENKT